MMNRNFGTTTSRAAATLLLCCAASLISGCAGNQFLSVADDSPATGATITGSTFGGNQPIIGASVQLWAVGNTGYGSKPTALGSAVTTAGPGGTFTIGAYTCPTATTQVYLTATGGNPGVASANPNLVLAAALGNCSGAASLTVDMNEVTTVATAYALGQYFATSCSSAPTIPDCIGSTGTTQALVGIANAFATYNNLVTNSTGNAVTSVNLPAACTSASALCITATPESGKLNTIADILAACVNTTGGAAGDGTACGRLFTDTTTNGVSATDTLQAAVAMSRNPTSTNSNTTFVTACTAPSTGTATPNNLCDLWQLVQPGAPFTAGTQPTDWTVGINYADIVTTTPVLTAPQNIAIDAAGDVWVASDTNGSNGALGELSPTGTPLVGTTLPTATGGPITTLNPRNVAVDLNGNVWIPTSSSSSYLFEYSPTGPTLTSVKLAKGTYGIAFDANNNLFVGQESSSIASEATAPLGPYTIYEFANANIGAGIGYIGYPVDGSTNILRPEYLAFDPSGNLWATDGGDQATTVVQISGITPCTPSGSPATCAVTQSGSQNLYTTVTAGAPSAPDGVAMGIGGIWYANRTGNTLTYLSLTGTTVNSGTGYGSGVSLSAPKFIAIDGAGNAWTASNNQTSPASISEISSSGTVVSPLNTGPTPYNVIGYSHAGLTTAAGVGIDPSGNVWVANNLAMGSTSGASVFELIGAATPTVTPIVQQVKNGSVGKP